MPLAKEVLKTLLAWFIAILIIVLIVWIPREFSFESTGYEIHPQYTFSTEQYKKNLSNYFKLIFFEKSLGQNRFGTPVTEDIKIFVSRSFVIIGFAFLIALLIGTIKGFFDYWLRESKWRFFGNGTTFLLQSLPDFFIIIVVQMMILSLMSKGFPSIKLYGHESWQTIMIASFLLSIFPIVYMARIVYASLAQEEGSQYIMVVKSKGMSSLTTLWKHQFGNSIFHVIPHIPTIMLYIMSNLLIIEYLMYFRGAALRMYEALGFAFASNVRGENRTPFSLDVYEPEVVIAILAMFIGVVALIQLICKVFVYYSPRGKGEN